MGSLAQCSTRADGKQSHRGCAPSGSVLAMVGFPCSHWSWDPIGLDVALVSDASLISLEWRSCDAVVL